MLKLRPPAVTFPGRRPPEGSGVCSPALEKTINARRKTGEEMTDSKRGQRGCADRDRSLKGTDHGDQPRPRTLDGREALSSPDQTPRRTSTRCTRRPARRPSSQPRECGAAAPALVAPGGRSTVPRWNASGGSPPAGLRGGRGGLPTAESN